MANPGVDLAPNAEPCPICGRVMLYRGGLVYHAKRAHNLDVSLGDDPGVTVQTDSTKEQP